MPPASARSHSRTFNDPYATVAQQAQMINQQVAILKTMPLNNATQITDAERALVGRWFKDGAPVK